MDEKETGSSGTAWDYAPTFTLRDAAQAFAGNDASAVECDSWMNTLYQAARNGEFPNAKEGSGFDFEYGFSEPATAFGSWTIPRADLQRWAGECGMRVRNSAKFLFPNGEAQTAAPWPTYTTPEIELLKKAIVHFWEHNDGKDFPVKAGIVDWLKAKGVSQNLADAMDTIMRPAESRKGKASKG